MERREMKEQQESIPKPQKITIEISGPEDLRRLIDRLPEGTVYSIDLSEVILIEE